jgi:hypothetical protein
MSVLEYLQRSLMIVPIRLQIIEVTYWPMPMSYRLEGTMHDGCIDIGFGGTCSLSERKSFGQLCSKGT